MEGSLRSPAMRPLVLLDVDGVVNALRHGGTWPDWRTGHAVAEGRTFAIRWSPSVVSRVLDWTEVADVRWLTTWGHDANRSLRHLVGLPELPVAGTHDDDDEGDPHGADHDHRYSSDGGLGPHARDDTRRPDDRHPATASHAQTAPAAPDALTGRWWKFDVVRRLVRNDHGRALVWLDDDLAVARPMAAWVRDNVASSLLVAPDPRTGLTREQLDAVDAFLAEAVRTRSPS